MRKNIAFVGQQIDLFNDSVKNNIAYGELSNKNEDDIRKACGAYASDFITNLPEGLNTKIGERVLDYRGKDKELQLLVQY